MADKLSPERHTSNWQLAKRMFKHIDSTYHKQTINHFALRETKHLSGYNTKWRDGASEAVDSLHIAAELLR